MSCPILLKKMGCYKDNQNPPRPLPEYILTDRDKTLPIYSKIDIDWGDWINYFPDFVCRCAKQAKSQGYKFFGVQFYGMLCIKIIVNSCKNSNFGEFIHKNLV